MASLTAIFQNVAALLPAGTNTGLGADKLRSLSSWPRVVFLPANEDYGGPQGYGGDGLNSPPPLWVRSATVEIHVWGKDFDATETLRDQVIQSIHRVAFGSYVIQGGQWVSDAGASDISGVAYVLTVSFMCPVTRPDETTATISSMATTTTMQFPSGSTYSESTG